MGSWAETVKGVLQEFELEKGGSRQFSEEDAATLDQALSENSVVRPESERFSAW